MKLIRRTNVLNARSIHGINSWSMSKFNAKSWSRYGSLALVVSWSNLRSRIGNVFCSKMNGKSS